MYEDVQQCVITPGFGNTISFPDQNQNPLIIFLITQLKVSPLRAPLDLNKDTHLTHKHLSLQLVIKEKYWYLKTQNDD